jgi:acylphosphatase
MQRRVHIIVSGRVQGVSYRANAQRKAASLGLVGWTRNRTDGSVEMLAEGPSEAVSDFITWCRKGPLLARVDDLIITDEPPVGEFAQFEVWRDA